MNEVIHTFCVGDQVLHPLHGAGTITSITIRQNGDNRQPYYAMHLLIDDAELLIPVACETRIGLRRICSKQTAQEILAGNIGTLPPQPRPDGTVGSGKIWRAFGREIFDRWRRLSSCLHMRGRRRALAGSEQRVLACAEKILYSELMLAVSATREEIEQTLEPQWSKLRRR